MCRDIIHFLVPFLRVREESPALLQVFWLTIIGLKFIDGILEDFTKRNSKSRGGFRISSDLTSFLHDLQARQGMLAQLFGAIPMLQHTAQGFTIEQIPLRFT